MKILREEATKEKLPVSFLTDFMSKGWEEVGYLKEASAAINRDFSDTAKVEAILQDLIDAYLVCIGQIELYLEDKDYVEYPEDDKKSKTDESADVVVVDEPKEIPDVAIEPEAVAVEVKDAGKIATEGDFKDFAIDDSALADARIDVPAEREIADFFVDFDEPDMTQPRLTDDELYGQEDSELAQARLRNQLRG